MTPPVSSVGPSTLHRITRAFTGWKRTPQRAQDDLQWADSVLRSIEIAIGDTPVDEIKFVVEAPKRKGRT
jgi:hypothetical protein